MKSYRTRNRVQEARTARTNRPAVPVVEGVESRRMFSTYVVTTAADSGTGSLRDAIKAANGHTGADVIQFKIGSGAKTIYTATGLPYVSGELTIDATTQPGYAGKPLIELNGSKSGGYGLNIGAGHSTVKGLAINQYSSGILLVKNGGNTVQGCYLGVGLDGKSDKGNADKGIVVQTADNTVGGIDADDRNVISGNGTLGVQFYTYTAANNHLLGNYIGTTADGSTALPNGTSGVGVYGAPDNVIGGTTAGARNVISGNLQDGIVINTGGATGTVIQGNYIGTDATGSYRVGNLNYGVETSQSGTIVGGFASGARNVISGNSYSGVVLWKASGSNAQVVNNYLGTDATGTKDIGNYWSGVDISNGSSDNLVQGNVISGNDTDGVMIYQGTNNKILYNTIGWDVTRKLALVNFRDGIRFTSTDDAYATGNYIGNNGNCALFRTGGGDVMLSVNTIINDTVFNLTV